MLSAAAKPGNTSTPSASACGASHAHMAPSETMKLPWLFMPGGTGSLRPPVLVSSQNSSSPAGTQTGGGLSRQPGSSASSGPGSITAPERIWAPTVEAFSITQTVVSGCNCLRRIANDSPAGPAPTTTTSYSIVSRSLMADSVLHTYKEGAALSGFARPAANRTLHQRPLAIALRPMAIIGESTAKDEA